jgi:2-amino-4-hydroxy-6-hydroxymethyldihydropteridine diphosphokinase
LLLTRAHEVERALGRDRAREQHWGPRTADIDIIAYEDVTLTDEALTLPHPRLFERGFVLVPLAEIAPDLVIGGSQVADAAARFAHDKIEKLPASS